MDTSYIMPVPLSAVNKTDWKFTGIYKITNTITGKCYIGQALNIRSRLMEHANNNHKNKLTIYKAIEKYGICNFEAKILSIINTYGKTKNEIKQELNYHECFYIDLYDSYKNGYNMTLGGDSGKIGYKHTKETIEKIRNAHKGKIPKVAKDAQRKTYGYDILTQCVIEAESVAEMSNKSGVDYRSIGQICRNEQYENGGRFIAGKRWLFAYTKDSLKDRIDFYLSGQRKQSLHNRHVKHWIEWRKRKNG